MALQKNGVPLTAAELATLKSDLGITTVTDTITGNVTLTSADNGKNITAASGTTITITTTAPMTQGLGIMVSSGTVTLVTPSGSKTLAAGTWTVTYFSSTTYGVIAGSDVATNADWSATSGNSQILNKPTLGTAASQASTVFATSAQGAKADTAVQLPTSTTVTAGGTLASWGNAYIANSASAISITLPVASASDVGKEIFLKNIGAGLVTVIAPSGGTLTGVAAIPANATTIYMVTALNTVHDVSGGAATALPLVDGTAATGTSGQFAKQDHVHPTDSTRQPVATLTAKGSLYVATAAATVSQQTVGTNGQRLIADSTQTTGVKWGNALRATGTIASGISLGAAGTNIPWTSAIATLTNTSSTVTLPAGRTYMLQASIARVSGTSGTTELTYQWRDTTSGTDLGAPAVITQNTSLGGGGLALAVFAPTVSTTVQLWVKKNNAVGTLDSNGGTNAGFIWVEELP